MNKDIAEGILKELLNPEPHPFQKEWSGEHSMTSEQILARITKALDDKDVECKKIREGGKFINKEAEERIKELRKEWEELAFKEQSLRKQHVSEMKELEAKLNELMIDPSKFYHVKNLKAEFKIVKAEVKKLRKALEELKESLKDWDIPPDEAESLFNIAKQALTESKESAT